MSPTLITINKHTTASVPRPHILYTVQGSLNGKDIAVDKRYSDFAALHSALGVTEHSLPPKRLLATTFIPSAWVDDALISERKAGLAEYLLNLLKSTNYKSNPILQDFLTTSGNSTGPFDLEDALPSTLSRKAALDLKAQALAAQPDVSVAATSIAAAYYPDWSFGGRSPESLDYSKFDILFFAFVTPNSSSTLSWDSGAQDQLRRLVASAKKAAKGTKIVLSVGGWGGSHWFSQACSTSANRTTFVNSMTSAVNTFGLDGVDIDWEYPNSTGAGNPHSSADAANLLSLITSLRSSLGSSKVISAAVPHLPWLGSNRSPLTNVSAYAAQMTYVNIMNYDVWGTSSNPGPNAPLGNLCGTSKQPQASAQAALNQWKAAGFPASKLLLGLPLYGYVSQSTKTSLTGSFAPSADMHLLQSDGKNFLNGAHPRDKEAKALAPQAPQANLQGWYGQQIPFNSIVSSGALSKASDGNYYGAGGFTFAWDNCSDTPFLYNTSQATVVTYDDTWSLADKATFAAQNGMAGCFTWSLDQDDGYTLMNVIRSKLGK